MMKTKWIVLMLSALLVAACGAPTPEADVWKNAPAAALNSRADLAQRLQVDPNMIKLVSVSAVNWPDGCLGVQTPDVMCTMVITPGNLVILEAGGKQYEYHTNASGDEVKLATPLP
jgi:hypothetical protein